MADDFSKVIEPQKSQKWDKKWHLVAFDVREKYRDGRDILRSTLKRLGFTKLQKSLFVSPFDRRSEIEVVKELYHIQSYVISILADDFDGAVSFVRYFSEGGHPS